MNPNQLSHQNRYFLEKYENLDAEVLTVIEDHRAEIMALARKLSDKLEDKIVKVSMDSLDAPSPDEGEDVDIHPDDFEEIRIHLIFAYVAGFISEQMPNAEALEPYRDHILMTGQHDGRALRIGREAPRH